MYFILYFILNESIFSPICVWFLNFTTTFQLSQPHFYFFSLVKHFFQFYDYYDDYYYYYLNLKRGTKYKPIKCSSWDIFLKKNGVSGVDSSIPHHVTVRAIPHVPLGWGYHRGNNMFVEVSLLELSWNLGLLSDAIKFLKNIQFPL